MRSHIPHYCAALVTALGLAFPVIASAQNQLVLGPGATVAPAYEGADRYRVLPIPIVDVTHGRLFLNDVDGIGIDVIQAGPITVGGSVTYVPGYRKKDAPDGVGRLSDTAGGRLFAAYQSSGFRLLAGATKSFGGGTRGMTADATISYTAKVSPQFSLTPSVGTSWADRRSDDRYFGIDAQQAEASGLERFAPGSGFRDVSISIAAKYAVSRHWIVLTSAGARGLLGNDADSPIVEHKWQPLGTFGVGYAF